MKTIRLIYTYMIIGVVSVLMASCATDDADYGSDLQNPDYMYNGSNNGEKIPNVELPIGKFEGVWFSIDNDKEPISTATMTVDDQYGMTFSSIPCDDVLDKLCPMLSTVWGLGPTPSIKEAALNFVQTAKSSVVSTSNFSNLNMGYSNSAFYFDVATESLTFPLRGEWKWNDHYLVYDELIIKLAPRKSIAVFDIVNNQWGLFLYYESAALINKEYNGGAESPLDLGYKFISTKRLE